ncbi:hypothetical protein B0H13DRAFT_1936591, partial [Mycena leptocephala]
MATMNAQPEQPEAVVSEPTFTVNIWLGHFLLAVSFQFGVADRLYMHPSWMNRNNLVKLVLFTCQLGSRKCRKTEYIDSEHRDFAEWQLMMGERCFKLMGNKPSYKLSQLEDMIKIVEEMLKRARGNCARDHGELSASKVQSRLLKTRNDTTWKKYLQSLRGIMQSIDECAKKVKKIQTSTLLTIQTEHQRQLSEGIKEFREVTDAVICSSTREGRMHMATRRRRFESEPTVDVLDESE